MLADSKILYSGILLFLITAIVKGLAFFKEIIVAHNFGMTGLTDAYNVAYLLPSVLIYVTGISVLTGIPTSLFSESIARNDFKDLSQTFSTVFNLIFTGTLVIALFCIWQMPAIIGFYAPEIQEQSFKLTVLMARILVPLLITLGISNYLSATLNAFRSFVLPGFSLIVANVCIILSLILLSNRLSILSLAVGTAAGFFLAFVIQFISIIRTKINYTFSFNIRSTPVKTFIATSVPLLFLTIMSQICLLIDRKVALGLFEGAFSSLAYSARINEIALNLFVLPFMTVLLPEFARDAAVQNINELKLRIRFSAEVLAAIIIFFVVFLAVFHQQIITILYHRGAFTAADVFITSKILLISTIGLSFQAGYLFLLFIYLGLKKTRPLALIGGLSYALNIGLIFVLVPIFGVYGLAAASAIMAFVYCIALFVKLKLSYIHFKIRKNATNLFKIFALGVTLALSYVIMYPIVVPEVTIPNTLLAMRLGIAFTIGLAFFVGMLNLLRIFSFKGIFKGVSRHYRG